MPGLLLAGARLIDGSGGNPIEKADILVEGSKIVSVGPAGGVQPGGVTRVDVQGKTVLPGLINAHEHLALKNAKGAYYDIHRTDAHTQLLSAMRSALALLCEGVTTVRDAGAFDSVNIKARDAVANGLGVGANIFACGRVIQPAKHTAGVQPLGMTYEAGSSEEVAARARDLLDQGANFLKMKTDRSDFVTHERRLFTTEELATGFDLARAAGIPTACQAMNAPEIRLAVEAGTESIEHGLYLHHDPSLADLMASKGVYYVPCYNSWALSDKGSDERREVHMAGLQDVIHAGVKLATGTDLYGTDLVDEMLVFVKAGLTPRQAIVTATRNGAELMGRLQEMGTVENGKRADLIVVDGDPERDLTALRNLELVILGGVVRRPSEMRGAIGQPVI